MDSTLLALMRSVDVFVARPGWQDHKAARSNERQEVSEPRAHCDARETGPNESNAVASARVEVKNE